MQVNLEPGKYVVAVSGGVDSMVLLDILAEQPDLELVVAHFDHGIRPDSIEDHQLVATLSHKHGLVLEFGEGKLGSGVSEDRARQARYEFLRQIRKKHDAFGVVTAHHQDDAVETLAFNVLRGTKRKGMSSLQATDVIIRPLLPYTKQEIREYAAGNGLIWREDSTNRDEKYARNWIRRKLLPKLSRKQRIELSRAYSKAKTRNKELDLAVQTQLDQLKNGEGLDRRKFIALPYSVASEVMAAWLRENDIKNFNRKQIDQLVISIKTLSPGKQVSAGNGLHVYIGSDIVTIR